jgi:cysteine desulfurase
LIYLDNHATTRIDANAMDAVRRLSEDSYANSGSLSHEAGRAVAIEVANAIASIASHMRASPEEMVMTSGATEANNLAILGVCLHPRQKRRSIVSMPTEHHAVLDPLERLKSLGFEVRWLRVHPQGHSECGRIDLEHAQEVIDESTAIASVMLANNETGVLQPIDQIAAICRPWNVPLHTDASQAVGHIDIDVDALDIDLLSFSAHKFYGPKGVGGLFVRDRGRRVKLYPQMVGGGQQDNRRSGTLNSPGIVGMAVALDACQKQAAIERPRIESLRNRLWSKLDAALPNQIFINGPALEPALRLSRNLNCHWNGVEGQSLMLACPELCFSSGSACTSANPAPSHVLQSIGLTVDQARCSTRFGLGRFNTEQEIDIAVEILTAAYRKLSRLCAR